MNRDHITLGLGVALAVRAASAQPAGAQAEILFRQGKELLASGKTSEACAAFEASQKLEPTVSTLLNAASCREKNGQLATAWGLFLDAERQTRSGSDDATKQLHKVAGDHAANLEPRLSTLTIRVPDEARVGGLEVLRDDQVLELAMWSRPLPIDGGTYKVTARAPGNSAWTASVIVANERDAQAVEIPRLQAAELGKPKLEAPLQPQASAAADIESLDERPPEPAPHHTSRLPYYLGGGALVALGGALTLELIGDSTYDRSKRALDVGTQTSLWHQANSERYAAEALAVTGIAAAGVAVWLYVASRHVDDGSVAVAPTASGDGIGIQVGGGF